MCILLILKCLKTTRSISLFCLYCYFKLAIDWIPDKNSTFNSNMLKAMKVMWHDSVGNYAPVSPECSLDYDKVYASDCHLFSFTKHTYWSMKFHMLSEQQWDHKIIRIQVFFCFHIFSEYWNSSSLNLW